MGPARSRAHLGQIQGRDEKRMSGDLGDAKLPVVAETAQAEAGPLQRGVKSRIDPVVAAVVLDRIGTGVQRRRPRAGDEPHPLLLAHERARERCDHEAGRVRAGLGMLGVLDPEDVARELDDRVLKAASGADERHAPLASQSDGGERAVHADVRTGGGD